MSEASQPPTPSGAGPTGPQRPGSQPGVIPFKSDATVPRIRPTDNLSRQPISGPTGPRIETIRIHAAGPKVVVKRSSFTRTVGFALAMLGVFLVFQTPASLNAILKIDLLPATDSTSTVVNQVSPATPATVSSGWFPDIRQSSDEVLSELKVRWKCLVAGIALLLLATFCIGGNPFDHIFSAAMFVGTAYVVSGLLRPKLIAIFGAPPTWPWITAVGTALAYLVHAIGRVESRRPAAVIGLILTGLAGAGMLRGWFIYPNMAVRLGGSAEEFVRQWQTEFAWGTVLLLTVIGVVCSRGRTIHFLMAAILASLAYACVYNGSMHVFEFAGTNWKAIEMRDIRHVPTWQWVLVGELLLLSAIMLHLSLGVGSLTIAFACVGVASALYVDKEMGRSALLTYSKAMDTSVSGKMSSFDRLFPQDVGIVVRSTTQPAHPEPPPFTPAQKAALMRKAQARLGITYGWIYLSAILAGVVGACGVRMILPDVRSRQWAAVATWFLFGATAVAVWVIWPHSETWEGTFTAFVVPRAHIYGVVLAAFGTMAFVSAWSLGTESRYATWLYTAVVVILCSTAMTLIGLTALIQFGGLEPMKVWVYCAIAVAQSSMMWVLMIHQSDRSRRGLAQ